MERGGRNGKDRVRPRHGPISSRGNAMAHEPGVFNSHTGPGHASRRANAADAKWAWVTEMTQPVSARQSIDKSLLIRSLTIVRSPSMR